MELTEEEKVHAIGKRAGGDIEKRKRGNLVKEKKPKINSLIPEEKLAKVLEVSKETLMGLRSKGCPYFKIGKRVFYHEQSFMEWLLRCHVTREGVEESGSQEEVR